MEWCGGGRVTTTPPLHHSVTPFLLRVHASGAIDELSAELINVALRGRAWDPYPFILLNLMLSMLAALQAPVIMMSQNRQDTKDRLRGELDFDVNRRAEYNRT